jgi:hypothetical protein
MKNRVMLYCGKEMIAMKNLVVASDFTRLPYSKVDSSTNCFHWKSYLGFHDAMQEYVRRKDEGEPTSNFGLTLSTILVLPASNLQATRPEDKIFAFYGICKHLGFELPPPDYRKSLAQIYTEAAIAILRHDGDLSMLQDVCESPGWELGLPSWVPNFAGSIREWTPSNPPNVSIYPKRHPRVAGSSGCHYELTQENQVLKVKGRRLDVVSEVGRAWKTDASTTLLGDSERQTGHYYAALLLCIGTWLDIVTKQDGNGHNSTSSETLTRVIAEGGSPPWDEQTTNHLARYLAILAETAAAAASETEDIETSTRPIMLAAGGDRLDGFQDAGKFTVSGEMHSAVRKIAYMDWKTVFSTARGLLAVGQHTVTKGDNVVILHGCSTAAVLRDWGGMYRYVGSAYVHGIMDGQSWEAGTSANDEWFELV